MKDIIQGIEFWKEEKEVIFTLESLVKILRLVDGDGSTTSYIYDAIERARTVIKKQCETNPIKYMQLRDLFETRREENILHEIHAIAAYLTPSLMYDVKIRYDQFEARDGLLFVREKLVDIMERNEFADQLLIYDGRHPNMFNFLSMAQMRYVHPRK